MDATNSMHFAIYISYSDMYCMDNHLEQTHIIHSGALVREPRVYDMHAHDETDASSACTFIICNAEKKKIYVRVSVFVLNTVSSGALDALMISVSCTN